MRIQNLLPWSPTDSLRRFNDLQKDFQELTHPFMSWMTSGRLPSADIKETEKNIEIEVDLPGLTEKDVKVSLQGDDLIVTGEVHRDKEEKREDYTLQERVRETYHRRFTMPFAVSADLVNAHMKNGLLKISVHKPQGYQSRTNVQEVPVQAA